MTPILHLAPSAADLIREEIEGARGNEVCFICAVDDDGAVHSPRAVARGHRAAVLAAVKDAESGSLVIHNHPSGALEPSDPDLSVAATLYAQGLGLAITDNQARELYVVTAPPRRTELTLLDEEAVAALLAPGGPISQAHPGYEDRPTQRDMTRAVAAGYNEGGISLAEAGTGTGKSMAYLVPAIRWARENGERTVVSTNTINLQEQLVGRDLPFLRRALGESFRFALVKGRGNYVSIRRARLALMGGDALFETGQARELEALEEWLDQTAEGSLQDLTFEPSAEVWDEVRSDSDACLRARCPHFEQCFYQNARRSAAGADVLVVNHHLLFSDVAVRYAQGNYTAPAVLPPYKRVVLDEAHNLEDAATSHLGATVSRRAVLRLLARLDRRGRGLLRAMEERLKSARDVGGEGVVEVALRRIERDVRPDVVNARERADDLFDRLSQLLDRAPDGVLRLAEDFTGEPEWIRSVEPAVQDATLVLDRLARRLDALREDVLTDRRLTERLEEQLVELNAAAGRTRSVLDALGLALTGGTGDVRMVRWLERRGRSGPGGQVAACAAPIDLAEVLHAALFENLHTAVLTSATLATRDGFEFFRRRLGLDRAPRVREAAYPSPFDFEEQTTVLVPTDLPTPGAGAAFDNATADVVRDVASASDGGVFALFTSYRSMRAVAADLRLAGTDGRWPLFVQGEESRARLLDRFTRSGRGILLGVASFWEGVDVPGHPLRGLVIAKLPFRVPTEPLTAARVEAIEAAGGRGFMEYILPHAALRLKQGFGRLVRSRSDRGAVVLLDRRVLEKSYGRYFLESLPPAPVQTGRWSELRDELERFYGAVPA